MSSGQLGQSSDAAVPRPIMLAPNSAFLDIARMSSVDRLSQTTGSRVSFRDDVSTGDRRTSYTRESVSSEGQKKPQPHSENSIVRILSK